MNTFAHIVNPVAVGPTSDLFVAQPITFETMRQAQELAREQVHVELYSAQYPEDRALVPPWLETTPDLTRSVLDMGTFRVPRKLPLLKDILDRLFEATRADYLIYTNVDIALQPHFYQAVDRLIAAGHDALVINRRTLPSKYTRLPDIPLMQAQIGEPHHGFDCFVFRRREYPRYILENICIGAPSVGATLLANVRRHATRFEVFTDLSLTFHLGNDQVWRSPDLRDYETHNYGEYRRVMDRYHLPIDPRPRHPGDDPPERRKLFQIGSPEYRLYERLIARAPPELAARVDRLIPALADYRGGPFNAQTKRVELFRQILGAVPFRVVVETGTFRGTTTEFLRRASGLEVFTVESSPRFHRYTALRFRRDPGVKVSRGDSRRFLAGLAARADFPREGVFFYLDAHWAKDLPLREEVDIIARSFRSSVIMIDDFEVPDDPGYGFDDYGPGKRLCLDYLPLEAHPDLGVFFPAARSSEESGARRGCVVLSVGEDAARALRGLPALRMIARS